MEIIYDANNWLRRRFEVGASIQMCYAEVRANPGTIVFDGPHALKRRREIFPGYKVKKKPSHVTSIFKQFDLFREALQWLDVPVVRAVGWEADDVIATLVKLSGGDIHVKSTDVDFLQLPRVTIDRDTPPSAEPRWLRVYKAVVGDPSDSIPGVKGFGKTTWAKLGEFDKATLELWLTTNTGVLPSSLPTGIANWMSLADNAKQVRDFYKIIGFYDVPMADIIASTTVGVNDYEQFEQQLKRFSI